MRTVTATRYVTPLREGGSLPGLVEGDDLGLYVVKLRGAGQGPRALVAELVGGELARALGLPVPELVRLKLDPRIAHAEPDPEIQDLLQASAGLNVGMDFLPGALAWLPGDLDVDPALAAAVVWFDALCVNVDRTPRNPNLLRWHRGLWLIDHGAAFYRHHAGGDPAEAGRTPFPAIRDHVLLTSAVTDELVARAQDELRPRARAWVDEALPGLVPPDWADEGEYAAFLRARLEVDVAAEVARARA